MSMFHRFELVDDPVAPPRTAPVRTRAPDCWRVSMAKAVRLLAPRAPTRCVPGPEMTRVPLPVSTVMLSPVRSVTLAASSSFLPTG